jgi:LacI family transcriptional regulator
MKDIAEELNVSVVTVSKVLAGKGGISPATRKRVLHLARKLNYQPNDVARSLVTSRTFMVGLVVPDLMNSFFAQLASGVAQAVRPAGFQVLIANSEEDPDLEQKEIRLLLSRRVDGLIIASAQLSGQRGIFRWLDQLKVPFVLVDREIPHCNANFVGVSGEAIGAVGTAHLIKRGRRRIAHIRGPKSGTGEARLKGYRSTLARYGLGWNRHYVAAARGDDTSGYAAMQELLKLDPLPDGVFCYNDPVAAGAIRAILDAGLKVPGDVAVIGAGNSYYLDLFQVPLSTIDQSSSFLGQRAAERLMELLNAKRPRKPEQILVPPKVVARASTNPVQGDGFASGQAASAAK